MNKENRKKVGKYWNSLENWFWGKSPTKSWIWLTGDLTNRGVPVFIRIIVMKIQWMLSWFHYIKKPFWIDESLFNFLVCILFSEIQFKTNKNSTNLVFRKRRKKSYARWLKIKWTYEAAMQNQKSQTYCGFNWYFYPGRCANGSISTQGTI